MAVVREQVLWVGVEEEQAEGTVAALGPAIMEPQSRLTRMIH